VAREILQHYQPRAAPGAASARALINGSIGERWLFDLYELRNLEPLADDEAFQQRWREVKFNAKRNLAVYLKLRTGVDVNPESLFDIQVKRIHEYQRQHLNGFTPSVFTNVSSAIRKPTPPRTFIFSGKAAPGYFIRLRSSSL
jgi:glycogen phosphorylase